VANSKTTTMTYDELNRIRTKSYTDPATTPTVTYCYDGVVTAAGCTSAPSGTGMNGRLTMVSNSEATIKYRAFDALGRVTAHEVSLPGYANPFVFGYEYDELALKTTVYPSGRRVTAGYDVAGRVSSLTGVKGTDTKNYVSSVGYAPHGGIASLRIEGMRTEQWCYNTRLQPTVIRLAAAATENCLAQPTEDVLRLEYGYGTTDNNGNVLSQAITRTGFSATQSYEYDAANRIKKVTEGTEYQNYGYTQHGNRWVETTSVNWSPAGDMTPRDEAWYDGKTNQLQNATLPVAHTGGNLTQMGTHTFSYDAENRIVNATVNSATTGYGYDGEGRRVRKGSTVYVRDAFGKVAAEYGGEVQEYATQYLTADHLGSTRLVTNKAGAMLQCMDYLPFGEEIARTDCGAVGRGPSRKFTGKERDTETGLDYFLARYYSGAQARFTSPDKLNLTDDRLLVPSTLNKYAYAANNPLRFLDPDGRDVVALFEPPHGVRPGHFALFAHNPDTNQAAFMSFGPTDQSFSGQLLTLSGGPVGSTVSFGKPQSADDLRRDYAALSIQTSPEQAQDVINFINGFGAAENPYRLFQANCSTVCRDALKAVGVLPRNYGSITPFGLWSALYRRLSNPAKQRFSTTTGYGEQFQSLRIDSQKGVDYGSPRFGMNTFDFIMLILRPKEEVKSKICYPGEDGKQVCQ
jgi:RHS repeat-associated protein